MNPQLLSVIDPPLAVAKKLIVMTAANQKMVVWAPGLLSSAGIENVMDIIKHVNFLILNQSECSFLSGISNPLSACRTLTLKKNNYDMGVIVTRAQKGCIFGKN